MKPTPEKPPADFVKSDYLTIGQLASNLGWSVRFIEGLVRGERLPGLEIDGAWHFRREDVIDWLEQKIQTLDKSRVRQLEKRVESSLVADGTYRRPVAIDRLVSRMPDDGITQRRARRHQSRPQPCGCESGDHRR